jgi:DNA-binding CsgD family transcriptional regulator
MRKCIVPWDWHEDVLPGDAWRRPDLGWELPSLLDLLAAMSSEAGAEEGHNDLIGRIVPPGSLREIHTVQVDADDALLRPAGSPVTSNLVAWVLECFWGTPNGLVLLREGRTIVRVRAEGSEALAYLCIPLRSDGGVQSIAACSITAPSREQALRMAARLTVLSFLAPVSDDLQPEVAHRVAWGMNASDSLTVRQLEILRYMSEGMTNRQIASRICFSESTVRLESMAIYRLLDVHSRTEAVAAARRLGLLSEPLVPLGA